MAGLRPQSCSCGSLQGRQGKDWLCDCCIHALLRDLSEVCDPLPLNTDPLTSLSHSPEAALDHFAMKRFYDDKLIGVTQPSQRRYVHYFADLLSGRIALQSA